MALKALNFIYLAGRGLQLWALCPKKIEHGDILVC